MRSSAGRSAAMRPARSAPRRRRRSRSSRSSVTARPRIAGERGPEVVRHRLQERVLHVVGDAQALAAHHALGGEVAFELLRPVLLGDVEEHALPVLGLAVVVQDQPRLIVDPDRAAVLARSSGSVTSWIRPTDRRRDGPLGVVGMHELVHRSASAYQSCGV